MILPSFEFKARARAALEGTWRSALVVVFFSGALLTLLDVVRSIVLFRAAQYLYLGLYESYVQEVLSIPDSAWALQAALALVTLVFTPALTLGANRYFIHRLHGEDLGVGCLLSRMRWLGRALWLYVLMGVKVFLWSLLLIVPGVIAALRYSMAPYYMAEDPALSAGEAIQKSKETMDGLKASFFLLQLSFLLWPLAINAAQMVLESLGTVVALVAGLFMQLALSTYRTAASTAFYVTVSRDPRPEAQEPSVGGDEG